MNDNNILAAINDVKNQLPTDTTYYCFGDYDPSVFPATHLNPLIQQCSTKNPPRILTQFSGKYISGILPELHL